MSKKKETYPFSHFFKEGAEALKEEAHPPGDEPQVKRPASRAQQPGVLRIPGATPADDESMRREWMRIRAFYRNGDYQGEFPEGLAPLPLSPLREDGMISTAYPVWVPDPAAYQSGWQCMSIETMIREAIGEMHEQGSETPVLDKQLPRLIDISRKMNDASSITMDKAMSSMFASLREQVDVSGKDAEKFNDHLTALEDLMPNSGELLPYSDLAVCHLLNAAIHQLDKPLRSVFKKEAALMISRLKEQLRINAEKQGGASATGSSDNPASFYDAMVRLNEISAMIPEGGSTAMDEARVERIRQVVQDLEGYLPSLNKLGYISIDQALPAAGMAPVFDAFEILDGSGEHATAQLETAFYDHIENAVRFIKALRIGELELGNRYQEDSHDDFFAHFDWAHFTGEEANIAGHFLLLTTDRQLEGDRGSELMDLVSKNLPVKIISFREDAVIQPSGPEADERHASLTGLMLAQKNIYLAQTSSITPEILFGQFQAGCTAPAPAFFHVFHPLAGSHQHPELLSSTAIEGRDFPGFEYRGILGTPWGSRFLIDNNPQPDATWPVYPLSVLDENGEETTMTFPFTYADKHFLDPGTSRLYFPVQPQYWREELVPLSVFLENPSAENIGKIPFTWMSDKEGILHKVAVSWQVVLGARERLDFWRFLQENCGINNYHVAMAVEQARQALEEAHADKIRKLKEAHAREIQHVRDEEADQVMENLTNALLNLDASEISAARGLSSGKEPVQQAEPVPETANGSGKEADPLPEEAEDEEMLAMEPYIDTALCTSCNECIQKNGSMFKYDADNMAFIADPAAGTFRELVEAAELCPVAIIHPGTPLNPDEPGLEDLVKRAEKFN